MQGDAQILELLNAVLTAEPTVVDPYFSHHKMRENWGHQRLSHEKREESIGEMKDADWPESQLHILGEIGKRRHLAEQIHE
jgi:bacterioferritin